MPTQDAYRFPMGHRSDKLIVAKCPKCKAKQWVHSEARSWHCEAENNTLSGMCAYSGPWETYMICASGVGRAL